jgi:synaptotagmin-14/16
MSRLRIGLQNNWKIFFFVSEEVLGYGVRFRLYGVERMRRERMIGESIIGFASLTMDAPSTHWVILEPRSNLSVSFTSYLI